MMGHHLAPCTLHGRRTYACPSENSRKTTQSMEGEHPFRLHSDFFSACAVWIYQMGSHDLFQPRFNSSFYWRWLIFLIAYTDTHAHTQGSGSRAHIPQRWINKRVSGSGSHLCQPHRHTHTRNVLLWRWLARMGTWARTCVYLYLLFVWLHFSF